MCGGGEKKSSSGTDAVIKGKQKDEIVRSGMNVELNRNCSFEGRIPIFCESYVSNACESREVSRVEAKERKLKTHHSEVRVECRCKPKATSLTVLDLAWFGVSQTRVRIKWKQWGQGGLSIDRGL